MTNAVLDKKPQDTDGDDDKHGPKLHFEHVMSVQDVKFRVSWSDTLQAAWDLAYEKLGEDRRPEDRLQSDDGRDMTPHLGKTMRKLFDDKDAKSHKFQIVGPTGGASK
jgi:hypothetical protein